MTKNWFTILSFVLLPCVPASANTLTITLDPATLSGPAGDELEYYGTVTNTSSGTVYLNDDNFNLAGLPLSSIDDSPFFANAPLSLGAGDTSGLIGLFDISIPDPSTPGNYDGTFEVLGGVDDNSQVIVGTADFTVNVAGSTSPVPEPSSFLLLGTACLGMGWFRCRRRGRA